MNEKKRIVMTNLIWRLAERCGAQGISFIVSILLARLLSPDDYGTVALFTVFIAILNVFVDSGLGNALIQKKDADNLDFSTVFYFNIIWCLVLYAILYCFAPLVSTFYGDTTLIKLMRVAGLMLIVSGFKNVQQAYICRTMQFKKFFFATLGGTLVSAVVGVWMAYQGYGAWALVTQNLVNATIDTIILGIIVKWRPERRFSVSRLKGLFSFGFKLLVSSLLETVYNNIRTLIIGKIYSTSDLAYYNKGKNWPNLFVTNINASIDSVLLPAMSSEQDEIERVRKMTRQAIKISTYIMAPVMMGLVSIATPLVRMVLTEKWLPSVFYMRIFCITYMFYPIHTANLNAVKAMGYSGVFLKLELKKKIVGIILLFSTMFLGVEAMAWSLLIGSIVNQVINSTPNKKILNYGYLEQIKDILPSIILAVIMGVCIGPVELIGLHDGFTVIIQTFLGMGIYIVGSIITKNESFIYLWGIVKSMLFKLLHRK